MKKIIQFIVLIFISNFSFSQTNQTPTFQWAQGVGGANGTNAGNSNWVDGLGNVYITGAFTGTVDFDPGVGVYTLTAFGYDAFVCKFDVVGNFVWAKQFTSSNACGNSIVLDPSGNIYFTGFFEQVTDFDPGPQQGKT
jgi:hypothetical protein